MSGVSVHAKSLKGREFLVPEIEPDARMSDGWASWSCFGTSNSSLSAFEGPS